MTSSIPQLTFALGNAEAPNTIYITTDPTRNRLLLAIGCSAEARFAAALPVPYRDARGATGSLLYLDLSELELSDAEFDAIEPSGDGWTFLKTAADRRICLAPSAPLTLRPNERIELHVDAVTLSRPPAGASAELTVFSFRVGGITRGNLAIPTQFQSLLQQPPDGGGDLPDAIKLEVPQPIVIGSAGEYQGVRNALSLVFSPGSRPREVRASADSSFALTFVYADDWPGFGALCTRAEAREIRVLRGQGSESWGITRGGDQESPSWLLQPEPGAPIVPADGVVELRVEELVTTLAGGPTLMLVSWTGVPGYQDGTFAVTLRKVPHVQITSFEVSPSPVVLRDGVADVTLSWTVEDAGALTLMPLYQEVTGRGSATAKIRETTTFSLEAAGIERASSGNQAIASATAVVLPVIDSFTAAPAAIYAEDFPRVCALAWSVNTSGDVELISSTGGPDPNRYAPRTGVARSIDRPQMLTLIPVETPQDLLVRRSLVLSAFTPRFASQPVAAGASAVAIAPSAGFVAVANADAGTVTALDTIVYGPLGAPVATGAGPAALAFAPGGSQLYVANSGDGTVSVLAVSAADGWPPYSLSLAQTLRCGGRPVALASSPDGRYLYVAIGNDGAAGSLAVYQRAAGGTFGRPSTISLGRDPRAVAVSPSGAQLFVPNAADDSVTVIGVSSGGRHQRVTTLAGFRSRPAGAAVTEDGRILLVACKGSDTVFAIDAATVAESERKPLAVGGEPQQIALLPGGAYALVANARGDDGLSLLGLGPTLRGCTVLERRVAAGGWTRGVAVSPDAGLALVADATGRALGLLTLAEYTQRREPVEVGAQTTSVVVTPDGGQALAWHDALLTFRDWQPSTGFSAYELESQTVTQQADGTPVIAIEPSPRVADRAAFLIARGSSLVDVISTQTWQSLFQIDVARATAGMPRGIAVSGDGRTLFVLTADDQRRFALLPYAVDVARATARAAGVVELFTAPRTTSAFVLASPDGRAAYAIDSIDRQLWIVTREADGRYRREPDPLTVPNLAAAAAISPDGARIYALGKGGTRNTISAVDLAARSVRTVTLPSVAAIALNGLTVSPDGTRVFATDGVQAGIRVFDAASLRLIQTISWDADVVVPYGVATTPTGTQVLSANLGDPDRAGTLAIAPQVQPAALERPSPAPADTADTRLEEAHADV